MRRRLPLLFGIPIALAGCGLKPEPTATMALLRAGNNKICTASDVQETLRQSINPGGAIGAGYTISFYNATLDQFDAAVSKANCRANIQIDGPQGTVLGPTNIDFSVLPSADDPSNIVVSAVTGALQAQLQERVAAEVASKSEKEASLTAQSELEATVKPGWLIGRWVQTDLGSNACYDGPYLDFGRRNVLRGPAMQGTWSLTGLTLQIITADRAATMAITGADTSSVQFAAGDAPLDAYRRCTRQDAQRGHAEALVEAPPEQAEPNDGVVAGNGYDPNLPTL